ncbi:sodium/proton antiporter, partial [Vibrio cholerae]|nr:sodium/proton antiporter [Vibrio cholerae]
MVIMAFPYTLALSLVGFIGIMFLLEPMTEVFYSLGWISHHVAPAADALLQSGH